MIKTAITSVTLAAVSCAASAAENVAPDRIVSTPKQFIGKDIRLSNIACVDPGRDFVCVTEVNGQALRIGASFLGATTSQTIADKMTTSCKGTANLHSKNCEFSIAISPIKATKTMMDTDEGTLPLTIIHSDVIDLFQSSSSPMEVQNND